MTMPTTTTAVRRVRFDACGRCGGDAFFDRMDEEWRCLQCARPLRQSAQAFGPLRTPVPVPVPIPVQPPRAA